MENGKQEGPSRQDPPFAMMWRREGPGFVELNVSVKSGVQDRLGRGGGEVGVIGRIKAVCT